MKSRNKRLSAAERLKEEIKYSNELNEKIKYFETKTKIKKTQNANKQANFEFQSEMSILKEKQLKLENELLVILNDENGKECFDNTLVKDFYELFTFEKKVNSNFRKNLKIVNDMIGGESISKVKDSNVKKINQSQVEVTEKIIDYLKIFNKNLIKINDEEMDFLTDGLFNLKNTNEKVDLPNEITKIMKIDYFNILSISDINYILLQEFITAPDIYNLKFSRIHINENVLINIKNIFKLEKLLDKNNPLNINSNLISRSRSVLGDEETDKIIVNLTRANELSFLKSEIEYKNIYSEFYTKIVTADTKLLINFENFKLKISNLHFFTKCLPKAKEKYNKRLQSEFPKISKEQLNEFSNTLDYIYTFRIQKKIISTNYSKDLTDLISQTSEIVEEAIVNKISEINQNIKQNEFDEMKEELKLVHFKNKEVFEIKQKLKNELTVKQNEIVKSELEKKEKEMREYYSGIKKVSENYKYDKKEKVDRQRKEIENENHIREFQKKEEIKSKLPVIVSRQKNAENKFVKLYKQKEAVKEESIKRQINLNNIIENLKVRPKVEIDPERVKKITESMKNRFETKRDEADKVILFENHGFTIDNLMNDVRYKIGTALSEAGLLNSAYSNELLNNLCLNLKK